jgi:3-hydroxyacyl-CoA dehydrogenase / enoyl-CoA hydratase / 3-hydroxybutyryl-CoA epimerase
MNALVLDPTHLESQLHEPLRTHQPHAFRFEREADGIGWLTFDQPGSSANLLSETTLGELDEVLHEIEQQAGLRALIIRSSKSRVFIAGADLKAVRARRPEQVGHLITLGQRVFQRLADLPLRKVAAIHGACVGGGLELALACDVRIATRHESTRLGLPETQLGLLPAWGGSTRLPRLLGLPKALDLILTGRLLRAEDAKRCGLIDEVVHEEHLHAAARLAALRVPSPQRRLTSLTTLLSNWPLSAIVSWKARRDLNRKTRGLYLAPLRALDVVARGLRRSIPDALKLEREAVTELATTEDTRRLIDFFFRREEATKHPYSSHAPLPITSVAVVGAGVMGSGIAHWLATRGLHVLLTDVSPDALANGMNRIRALVKEGVKRRVIDKVEARDTLDRIATTHERVPLNHYSLVIEAASENLEVKKCILRDLAARCGADTLLATNTSALCITEMAESVPHPERVLGLHFFNPVHRMQLVEVIVTKHSQVEQVATLHHFAQKVGKTPVVVKDSPGFIVNRILTPYLMEAVRLVEQGHRIGEVDEAMLEFGLPMGPLRLLDEIGLDVAKHVADSLGLRSDLIEILVNAGHLGKKTGRGFYDHSTGRPSHQPVEKALRTEVDIAAHLAGVLSDEAERLHAAGIARSAADIDLAMVLGTGYPPFRGGPLAYAGVDEMILGKSENKTSRAMV